MKTNRRTYILLACLAGACLLRSQASAATLIGAALPAPASVDLTAEGTLDWAHWALDDETSFDQKVGGANEIGNFSYGAPLEGPGQGNGAVPASWSDGTPTAAAADTDTFLECRYDTGGGFEFTVAASANKQLLRVYVQAWNTVLHFEAGLSDSSAPAYVDESLDTGGENDRQGVYAVVFASTTPGATLNVKAYDIGGSGDAWFGIASATLATPPPGPTVMGPGTQVQSVTVYNGSEASFSFAATNDAVPMVASTYQWYKNSQPVTAATGTQFTFLAGPGDTNAQVYCVATLLPVFNPNNLPPLTSATGTVTVLPSLTYTNGLKVEFFPGASRLDVEAGNVGPASSISLASSFEMPVDADDDYTRRVSGYFIPPTSGDYVFFICSDDDSDLFLSTDNDPAHKRLIAQEGIWSDSREWTFSSGNSDLLQKRSDQWSPDGGATMPYANGISLIAGRLYYLEGVQHEGSGGDNFAATYKLITDADPLDDDPPLLQATNHNIALMTGPATNLVWVTQPVSVTNSVGRTVTFTSSATSDGELQPLYQWYRNNSPVPGATGANYSFPANLADNNTQWYVTASTAEGGLSITSGEITLTVKPASFPQGLITFEDQDPATLDTPDFQPNPYTDVEGLPAGVTATFSNWGSWNADPQHTPGGIWLLYGMDTGDPSIAFNMPVGVPSIWVTTGPFGTVGASLKGYLKGIEQFAYTNRVASTFVEVTSGANVLIDSIVFSDYVDSEIDDILIVKPTTLLTFSEQVGNDGPAHPNPYTGAQGLWFGVTVTFDQFNNWNGSPDHTPDTTDNYLLYGAGGIASMTFNTPVEVPSLWVSTQGGGRSGVATLKGYLNNVEQFTYTITGGWVEVTAGAGKPIDSIRFIDYGDSWIDDITVNAITNAPAPPAPASLSLVKSAGTVTLSWTGQGRLEESLLLTSGWTTSPSQANPQNVSTTTGAKFYRIVNP